MNVAEGRGFLNNSRKNFAFLSQKKKKKKKIIYGIISNSGTTQVFTCFQNTVRFICVNLIVLVHILSSVSVCIAFES